MAQRNQKEFQMVNLTVATRASLTVRIRYEIEKGLRAVKLLLLTSVLGPIWAQFDLLGHFRQKLTFCL